MTSTILQHRPRRSSGIFAYSVLRLDSNPDEILDHAPYFSYLQCSKQSSQNESNNVCVFQRKVHFLLAICATRVPSLGQVLAAGHFT